MLDGRPPIAPGRVPGGGKGRGVAVTAEAAVDGAAAAGAVTVGAVAAAAVATGASAGGWRGAIGAVWIAPGRTSTVCTGTG